MSFWGELKRRNVFKVGAAYVIVAWLIVQVASTFFPILHLPDWAITLVAALLILGFPIALIHAWAYEVTPDGIKRTKEVPLAESITHLTGRKLNYVLASLLIIAVGYIIVFQFFTDKAPVQTEVALPVTEQTRTTADVTEPAKTVAVLPFADLSPEKDQEYFVDGLSEEVLNSLAQIPELTVIARTSSFSFKGTSKTIQEIADVLGVENILEGSVRKAGNELRITAQLVRATDGAHLWSKAYDRKLENIFEVQENIAKAVADELKTTLGIDTSRKKLGRTDNVEAYEHYLVAKGQLAGTISIDRFNQALKSIDTVITLDPEFALAWAAKAYAHIYLVVFGPANRSVFELDAALNAAQRAIELEPNLAAGYYSLGFVRTNKGEWIEAESAYRKALELPSETLSGFGLEFFIAVHYCAVGNFKKAHEFLEKMRQNDPLNQTARGLYMLSFAFLGDTMRAENEYEDGRALFGVDWFHGSTFITNIRLGSDEVVSSDIVYSNAIYNIAREHLNAPEEGLEELHRFYNKSNNLSSEDLSEIGICAAFFGDPEFALDAIEKGLRIQTSGAFFFWFPVLKEVRRLPRFKEFVREIGLVDYWKKFGWPDICRPLDNGDFVCD